MTMTTGETLTLTWIWTFTAVGGFFALRKLWKKRRREPKGGPPPEQPRK